MTRSSPRHAATPSDQLQLPLSWMVLPWSGFILSQIVIGFIAAVGRGDPTEIVDGWGVFSNFTQFAIVLYVLGSAVGVGALLVLLRIKGLAAGVIGLPLSFSSREVSYALLGAGLASLLYLGVAALLGAFGVPMFWYQSDGPVMGVSAPFDLLMVLGFAVTVGPAVEEVVFRGYVLTALLQRGLLVGRAMTLSALIFTSVHVFYGPGVLVFIFLWAFIPAFLFHRFGNLGSAILFHCLNNLIAFLLVPLIF